MKESELRRAIEPVNEYFSGREITVNTVLAAYLRSRGLPASGRAWERAKEAMRAGADFESAVATAESEDAVPMDARRIPENERVTAFSGDSLEWFPKQFGPGDIDGVGAKRLLGTPNIDPAWVLVRETAQNSWDAKGTAEVIDFTMNLQRLDPGTIEVLRGHIFTGDAPRTGLGPLLQGDEVWALEVSDRGTVGLGGPIRNDLAIEAGEDTNFIDLVFNIGAPRDVHLGGGTYGFGKTISYVASGVGTVLIWSRCQSARGLEHRLIGSAIGDGYNKGHYRYTGRHWWGNAIPDEDRVEPVVGQAAQGLAELAFTTSFEGDATGTSILILDPQLRGESPEECADLLADAVVRNLWPKLLAHQDRRTSMNIRVQLDGVDVSIPPVERHPELSGHAQCLMAVRAVQSGGAPADAELTYPVEVQEVWLKLPETLLGHLALTRYPAPAGLKTPSHSVTLMRHQAELVVRSFERPELDVEGFQWAGVFKPVAAVDDSFAQAEPPAHDDWIAQAVQNKPRRREVNVALRRIREATDQFLSPRATVRQASEELPSAAHVGDMLADLVGGLEGPAPSLRRPSTRPGGKRIARPRADIVGVTHTPGSRSGWTRTTLDVRLADAASGGTAVEVSVRVGVDGGSWVDAEALRQIGWEESPDDGDRVAPLIFLPGSIHRFAYEAAADLAIDVETRLVLD